MATLTSLLKQAEQTFRDRPALAHEGRTFTWNEHVARVSAAAGLLQEIGIGKGERFAILSRNQYRVTELLHAGYWSGAIPVPVNFRLAPAEIAAILDFANARAVFIDPVFSDLFKDDQLAAYRARCVLLDATDYETRLTSASALPPQTAHEDEDALLLFTGGTTGRGKGVRLTHRNIVANGMQIRDALGLSGNDRFLYIAPMFHSSALLATSLVAEGGSFAYVADFDPASIFATIADCEATITMMAPAMVAMALEAGTPADHDLDRLHTLIYGSSPIAEPLIRRVLAALPNVGLVQGYGLTETSPILTFLTAEDHRLGLSKRPELLTSGGRVLPGSEVRIMDGNRAECAPGKVGEIIARGANVTPGYLDLPEVNAATFRDGWMHTGDAGYMDKEGYLYVVDRKKDMIVTGGENVYSVEVESVLISHPAVSDCAVIGVPDETFGEAVFAVIVAAGDEPSSETLIAHCRNHIGGYKVPRRFAFVGALPRSAMGKVLKADLRAQFGG